jgi:4-hydroxythreonine-4-phosphate dehydrogenase
MVRHAEESADPITVLLTCGDPAGVGPEVTWRTWAESSLHATVRLRVVGDPQLLAGVLESRPGLPPCRVTTVDSLDPRCSAADEMLVIPAPAVGSVATAEAPALPIGRPSALGGRSAAVAVETACRLVLEGRAHALVTGPLHKQALHAAGYDVPGHTELLARACGLPDDAASMMLWLPAADGGGLGVVHTTLHEPLARAVARLTPESITHAGDRLHGVLSALLGRPPRLAVAALNPHAGEGGLFGDEEDRIVVPAVRRLAQAGIDVTGPLPADTLFLRASGGEFDGVVALYHDQGHIPIKLLGMHRAVNVTLGLPLVRTSVAHGTAFDIAGRGLADASSLRSALDAAVRLVTAASGRASGGAGP